ncbi:MAG: hypothetical protein K2J44_00230, partial [Ruminococcus sp.]|nr:hypothetical protein [Ruminococcus sp.]
MNKNELKDNIKNALDDLKDDYTIYSQRQENFQDINNNKADIPKSLMMTELWHYSEHSGSETKRTSLEKHFSKNVVDKLDILERSESKRYLSGFAIWKLLFPQIVGFIIGCAFARMFDFELVGYM